MIIGICGRKRCGKDTIADWLVNNYGFIKYNFGDLVKEICKMMFNFTDDQISTDLKDNIDPRWGISPREIFQVFGTDFAQFILPEKLPELTKKIPYRGFWIQRFKLWYNSITSLHPNINIVVSDVRFIHEYNCIKDLNGLFIEISRICVEKDLIHSSENEIESFKDNKIDLRIKNNDSKIDLFKKMRNFIEPLI